MYYVLHHKNNVMTFFLFFIGITIITLLTPPVIARNTSSSASLSSSRWISNPLHSKSTILTSSNNNNNIHSRIPIIFANRNNNNVSSLQHHHGHARRRYIDNGQNVQMTSSRSYEKYYTSSSSSNNNNNNNSNEYEDGSYDDEPIDEWDRLEKIKKDLQSMLGGYRPWSIDTRSRRPGVYSITTKLVITNIGLYAMQMFFPKITRLGAKRSDLIMEGKELHRLVTPVFLHGSITHLLMNTFSLQNIGPEVERLFGGGRYLSTYLLAGVAGNVMSAYNSPNPSIGASGAVFGLMGAYYAFLSQNERLLGRSGQDAMGRVSGTLFLNVLFGLASPAIDNWAHIGGALGGG